jgi:DNA-binding PadR family transcriptional regulator
MGESAAHPANRGITKIPARKVRRYYWITPAGRKVLAQVKDEIRELAPEVLAE